MKKKRTKFQKELQKNFEKVAAEHGVLFLNYLRQTAEDKNKHRVTLEFGEDGSVTIT